MRNPCAPAGARSALFAAALVSAITALAPTASAQQQYDRLFVFGDSFADLTLSDKAASNPAAPPGVALNLWRVYPLPLQSNLGIPGILDFAVGGAQTSNLPSQFSNFQGSPTNTIGPRDLVTLNIGGNDAINPVIAGTINLGNAVDKAKETADRAFDFIQKVVNAGGRTFVLGEFSGLSGLPIIPNDKKAAGDLFGQTYFNLMQQKLAPLGQSGIRFFMLNLHALGQKVEEDPTKFGLERNPLQGNRSQCSPTGGIICGGSIKSDDQNRFFLGPDGLHLTNAGFALVAAYMANIVMAPDTIAAQPGIVMSTAGNFTGSLLGRLDAVRQQGNVAGFAASSADGPMGLGRGSDRRGGPPSRLTAFTLGTFAGGDRSSTPDLTGFDYTATSGTVGLEYRVNPNLVVGLAGNFTTIGANLDNGASSDIDAVQAAVYASYTARHWFGDALLAVGHHDLDLARPGIIDTIRGSTDATSFAAAAKGGYLFDFGSLRAGPIAGLTYIHARVDGYTETGDPLLAFTVAGQTLESITGNVGVQVRAPFMAGGNVVSPFLNVTLEHQFGDTTRTLTASLVQAPILPILTPVSNFDSRTYGRVEGGVTFEIGPNVSATINASSTFAREEGNDWRVSTGLNYRF
ncbi:MAG: autotransporter domain-containing protein [Hyphomonadaceae bacterium]|nr:autotransporter domain-containing protein [Hyphomonadaceae bacterium]